MTTRRLFNVVSLVTVLALVMAAVLTIRLTVATTEVVSGSSSHAASALDQHEQSASQSTGNSARSYRNPLVDECFDVPLREATRCHEASRTPVENTANRARPYRNPLDECFDVPLREAVRCHEASRAPVPDWIERAYLGLLRQALRQPPSTTITNGTPH